MENYSNVLIDKQGVNFVYPCANESVLTEKDGLIQSNLDFCKSFGKERQIYKEGKHKYPFCLIDGERCVYLTQRQADCLRLTIGHTIKNIGKKLGLSPRTIEFYLVKLKLKLNCRCKNELAKFVPKIKRI